MKLKSEVRNLVVQFCKLVETQFSKNVKSIRTDNAKEFDMHDFYKSKGIIHQNSCIHTPQQNSLVERKHQHLLAVARALRLQSSLPLHFWIDCVLQVAYLINVTPTPVLSNRTPFEVLFQKKPKIDHLKVFGCLVFASVLPKPKTKMHLKATKCVFIGYPKGIKGYRLYDMETKDIFVSRDVVFTENKFPFQTTDSGYVREIVLPTTHDASVDLEDCLLKQSSLSDFVVYRTVDASVGTEFDNSSSAQASKEKSVFNPVSDSISQNVTDSVSQHVTNFQPNEVVSSQSSLPTAPSARPSRNVRLPQKYKDFHVYVPKMRTSPHNIAHVISYDSISSKYQSYINNTAIITEPKTYKQAVLHDCWKQAMSEEILALQNNDTLDLDSSNKPAVVEDASVVVVSSSRGQQNTSYRGRGRGRYGSNRPQCQLCGRYGHLVQKCYYRFDQNYLGHASEFKGNSSNANSSKMNTSSQQLNYVHAQPYAHMVSGPVSYSGPSYGSFFPASSTPNHVMSYAVNSYNSFPGSFPGSFPVSAVPTPALHSYSSPPAAFVARPTGGVSSTTHVTPGNRVVWYPDSGATHHITSDRANLQADTAYTGTHSLLVGNGAKVNITHVGLGSLASSCRSLQLRDLLYVPDIKKNLLSVSQFARDNNVYFEFFPYHCAVKDIQTKTLLLRGRLTAEGLYELRSLDSPMASSVVSNGESSFVNNDTVVVNTCAANKSRRL
ncbi:hypothetical protein GQ457_16G011320 [Hibiscus cannabinus]